ncbi:NAD(P)/FAD-dependent oxidoreductase [Leekyejoonella antrihumi]|uniref:NAD(P)/FAD-dependent oxidoreductase n=1 Tax=Leekyejoonella antrihumi TaxID=1660198 RepID=A0A563DYN8_9MICO|nr:FAD-dependent oxidoreductase [Leekyejoonella antrihumi]TWP35305.1 NAD(P)/FAD-dependent oxidoreductase [Leekyejoonella antrihumi]
MGTKEKFVIVGAGLAGAKTAEALRDQGFDGRILLIGEESDRPYERPPLSKDFLRGRSERNTIYVHPQSWYAEHDVDLRLKTSITGINPARHEVSPALGEPIAYDKLLLATGSTPRRLTVPGADPHRVFYLRRVEDCMQLRFAMTSASKVVVIGGGWIGLEVAAAASEAGLDVTVLEADDLPLLRVLGSECAQVFAKLHRRHGVDLRLGTQVVECTGDDPRAAAGVQLADGSVIEANLVVVGVGASPNTALARDAGLVLDNGIRVDEHLRTSDNDIYAVGDVANAFHPALGRHLRVEHWANALHQPAVAAASMLGRDAVYDQVPYFYSDQHELGMEYRGYVEPGGYDEVVFRGDTEQLEFVAFWLRDKRVQAAMNVNVWDQGDTIESLIRSNRQVDCSELADPHTPMAEALDG